jgi:hypothetical protein
MRLVTARLGWVLLAMGCMLGPATVRGAPREVVEQIASLIEDNYFDATRAGLIAGELRAQAQVGRFDALAEPQDLAAELTEVLRPRDHHFSVTWSQQDPAGPAITGATLSAGTFERRNNFGFRRIEMLPGAIGYVDVRTFYDFASGKPEEPARRAADAVLALLLSGDAVIIDLRNNPGGSATMVGYLASAFTKPDADIYDVIHYRAGIESERPSDPYPHPRLDVPLYILISGRTASAAEAMAYELQAASRAVIVGEASSGAANPGGEFPVGEGFSVFVSIGTAVNPLTRTNWEGKGVQPDVHVPAEQALRRAQILALEEVLARAPEGSETEDTRWVLEALRAEHATRAGSPLADYVGDYTGAVISESNGTLALRRGRRPPWTLVRVRGDVFFVKDEPLRRVEFERGPAGEVKRFQLLSSSGRSIWARKLPAAASAD